MKAIINQETKKIITLNVDATVVANFEQATIEGFELSQASFRNLIRGKSAQVGQWVEHKVEAVVAVNADLLAGFYQSGETQSKVISVGRLVVTTTKSGYRAKIRLNAANKNLKKVEGHKVVNGTVRFKNITEDQILALASKLA
ncbi:hypothetical protein [Vibrio phage YC]|uniref:Uncharacterized protein n=1 Tax=Vibrio phage YC TaxID=2267403 RepID=A0A384ZSA2_9CAUD|nr:hypothetical protein HWB64_gp125 [Vibrio phage YC]AXC34494.1 hypothetical protein [Vibrio phage YC]